MTPAVVTFEKELGSRKQLKSLESVLPQHIDVRQFCRLAVMAVQRSPSLLEADRQSLFQSLQACAVDGLIPDGREAALVEFKRKQANGQYGKTVQYMPMVGGILKRARQSGQVAGITARCVYENDEFSYWIDESGEHLRHVPAFTEGRQPGSMLLVYAMAKMVNGEVIVEPLSMDDLDKIKKASRAGERGPWVDWFERMAEKSALHRITRRLPCSSELSELMERDNWLYREESVSSVPDTDIPDAPQDKDSRPSEDDALMMNDVMGRIMGAGSVDDLKNLAVDIEGLHPDFQDDAILAVEEKRAALAQ